MPLLGWGRTSKSQLSALEDQIFSCLRRKPIGRFVEVDDDPERQIWTVTMEPENKNLKTLPLVMLHGMGSGVGLWLLNLEQLSLDRTVHAFDLPGFGRSYRAKCSKLTAESAESSFIDAIESWRKHMKLKKFFLLGHSLGGFLASAYALKHPEHIEGLILVDSWGFPQKDPKENRQQLSKSVRAAIFLYKNLNPNPLSVLRVAGPWGPSLISRFRPDLIHKFKHPDMADDSIIAKYVYQCNAQEPSGEMAFKSMVESLGWAKNPMIDRIGEVASQIPITMINGEDSWVDCSICHKVKEIREKGVVNIEIIKDAGHHVYADQAEIFNEVVRKTCLTYDKGMLPKHTEKSCEREGLICEDMMEHVM